MYIGPTATSRHTGLNTDGRHPHQGGFNIWLQHFLLCLCTSSPQPGVWSAGSRWFRALI